MSVVAGCSLLNGVLLAADCRATIRRKARPDIYSDNVCKVIALFPHTAIGFVGDIDVASFLLRALIAQMSYRRRSDPISLLTWLPRLFRYGFSKFVSRYGDRMVIFMVGSVLKDRPNIVQRKAVADLVNYIGSEDRSIKGIGIPHILTDILKFPSEYEWVPIPGTYMNILYDLASPSFQIRYHLPLESVAIGSGESVIEDIIRSRDRIFRDYILATRRGFIMVFILKFRESIILFVIFFIAICAFIMSNFYTHIAKCRVGNKIEH
jgi:hypothetical protein